MKYSCVGNFSPSQGGRIFLGDCSSSALNVYREVATVEAAQRIGKLAVYSFMDVDSAYERLVGVFVL
jgi:hypothetical protein